MTDVSNGYPAPLEGPAQDGPAEERHDVTESRRSSSGSNFAKAKRKRSCPLSFGVKSYLHQFYDDTSFKDPSLYEEDDHQFLLQPHSRRRCMPVWWKIFMWLGVTLLLFGVVSILLGYLVPPRRELMEVAGDPHAYVDTQAQVYNATLEMCKLIGLVLFCVGGGTLAMALLFPSFLASTCEEEDDPPGIKVPLPDDDRLHGLQSAIPSNSKVKNVQPEKKAQQRMMTSQVPE